MGTTVARGRNPIADTGAEPGLGLAVGLGDALASGLAEARGVADTAKPAEAAAEALALLAPTAFAGLPVDRR